MSLVEILDAHRDDILHLWMDSLRREAPETGGCPTAT